MQAYKCDRCGEKFVELKDSTFLRMYKRYTDYEHIEIKTGYDLCPKCMNAFMIFIGRNTEEV